MISIRVSGCRRTNFDESIEGMVMRTERGSTSIRKSRVTYFGDVVREGCVLVALWTLFIKVSIMRGEGVCRGEFRLALKLIIPFDIENQFHAVSNRTHYGDSESPT